MSVSDGAQVSVKVAPGTGVVSVSTGLSALDYLIAELATAARLQLTLEAAPGAVDQATAAAGRRLGEALDPLLHAEAAAGRGFAWLPADEALAGAAIEITERPML